MLIDTPLVEDQGDLFKLNDKTHLRNLLITHIVGPYKTARHY